jgi:flagella basal body P-ring formation protein FlgA
MIGTLALGLALAQSAAGCRAVAGERILAGDLAGEVAQFAAVPAEVEIGWAPAPGARRLISRAEVERTAARHGVKLEGGARAVCFERRLEPLDGGRVRAALEQALAGENARLEIVDHLRAPVPEGALEFPPLGLTRWAGSPAGVIWRGRVRYGAGRSYPIWARVRVSVTRPRVVALRALAAGQPIAADSIEVRPVDGLPFERPAPASVEAVAGRAPRRLIPAGQPIEALQLGMPREVEAGATVQVESRLGATRLAFEARAESGGRVGDRILVRNPATGKRFRGVVEARGKVTVEEEEHPDAKNGTVGGLDAGAGGGRGGSQEAR